MSYAEHQKTQDQCESEVGFSSFALVHSNFEILTYVQYKIKWQSWLIMINFTKQARDAAVDI